MTETLTLSESGLERAAQLLRQGGLVAFPTETVYGLGALATNDSAVARIYQAKGRPSFNPLILHVADLESAEALAEFGPEALKLARAFWPGPLTLVLPRRDGTGISPLVSAGLPRIALRVPAHPVAHELLTRVGGPVAAPSANPSGRVSPTRAAHVLAGLDGRIDAVLDGGACGVGVESTIIGFLPDPVLLRPGGVAAEDVEAVLGRRLATAPAGDRPEAPGQLASHYAPQASLRLNATRARGDEFLIGFGPVAGEISLSAKGDLVEAAASLFHALREADATGRPIAVAPVPMHGLGLAINDRLARAAAPRG
jgi:L-threonylcarbamoyladenylate synthase